VNSREDLLAECDAFVAEHKAKADRNERRARFATAWIVVAAATIPVLIIASTQALEFLLGKLLPAILAGTSAVTAGFLQFERPHERWSLYRRYQRLFEAERFLYTQKAGTYTGEDADERFSEWLARQRLAVHDEWAGLLPAGEQIAQLAPGRKPS
jgi:hypothetical protein